MFMYKVKIIKHVFPWQLDRLTEEALGTFKVGLATRMDKPTMWAGLAAQIGQTSKI